MLIEYTDALRSANMDTDTDTDLDKWTHHSFKDADTSGDMLNIYMLLSFFPINSICNI